MRILAIRGRNLASLTDFDIDLSDERLANNRIFAITGPTGAGKSTILDAVCLALYDRTPRNLSEGTAPSDGVEVSGTDPRSIARKGATSASAEVEFLAQDGQRLRATWEVWRARKKATGKLQAQRMRLFLVSSERELSGHTKSETLALIRHHVGLSFDEFRRAVLLAQGDFAAFLGAKPDERAELLERMTGTEVYARISADIFRRTKVANAQLEILSERLDGFSVLPPKTQAQKEQDLVRLGAAKSDTQSKLDELREHEAWHARDKQLAVECNDANDDVEKATARWAECQSMLSEFTRLREASHLGPQLEALESERAALGELNIRIQALKSNRSEKARQLDQASCSAQSRQQELSDFRITVDANRANIDAATELEIRIREVAKLLDAATKEKDLSEENLRKHSRCTDEQSAQINQTQEHIEERKTWLAAHKNLRSLFEDWSSYDADMDHYVRLNQLPVSAVETKSVSRLHLALSLHRKELLKPGEPCPLCGAAVHLGRTQLEAKLQPLNPDHPIESCTTPSKMETFKAECRQRAEVWQEQNRLFEAAKEKLSVIQSESTHKNAEHSRLTEDLRARTQAFEEQRRLVQNLRSKRQQHLGGQSTADVVNLQNKSIRTREAQLKSSLSHLHQTQQQLSVLETQIEERAASRTRILEEEKQNIAALDRALAKTSICNRADLRELLGKDTTSLAEQEIDRRREALSTAKARLLDRLDRQVTHQATKSFSDRAEETQQSLKTTQSESADLTEAYFGLKQELQIDHKAKKEYSKLCKQQDKARAQLELLAELNEVIGSSDGRKFRAFAQSITLDALIYQANLHLTQLRPRYRIKRIRESTMGIEVIDQDMGDEIRSASTLSGGERFLVSLALALGLSALSACRVRIDSLFIDEGFGSLDRDTLDIALSVLDELQVQGRTIGLISHVPEIAERVAEQIRVQPIRPGCSRVICSRTSPSMGEQM